MSTSQAQWGAAGIAVLGEFPGDSYEHRESPGFSRVGRTTPGELAAPSLHSLLQPQLVGKPPCQVGQTVGLFFFPLLTQGRPGYPQSLAGPPSL